MKFSCTKEYLERALSTAERFTGKNLTLPVLGNVLLECGDNQLIVTATNLEYAVQIGVAGKTVKTGKVTIPGKIIASLIQSLKDEKVELEESRGHLLIKTATREVRMNGVSVDDFPLIPPIKKNRTLSIDANLLKKGIDRVLPSVALSDFKPEFTGVLFKCTSQEIHLVTTDTFRLAEQKIPLLKKQEESFSFIVPHQVAQEISRIIDGSDKEIKLSIGDNQLLVETGSNKITSRLIDGNFPDYASIIPQSFGITLFAHRATLKDSIKASSIFASKLSDVALNFGKDTIEIASSNEDVGEYKNTLAVKTALKGKDMKINYNYRYLLDGLNALDEDEILIGCNSEQTPSLFHNKSDKSFLYVLMPIRLS